MTDVERRGAAGRTGSGSGSGSGEEDYGRLGEHRTRRMRIVAWVTIASLILIGGGSTVLSLLFG
ncbi:hypothetical protein DC31_05600 [Microbacterium sp. CH12i]|uniref:hypothetical protein n=1 Tax=Microbacterium sp. CH12i TaxID=1479651 RepID=UPI000460FA76|nr:hypothetical protein [Microbacterium sp. CH12i]KDA04753.1 hypothetical protein DC31_05600 [Microbacterium sp. CH12i]